MTSRSGIGLDAQIPNPALARLNFLVGDWRTVGTHPALSEQSLEGRTSFSWHEGGAFLVMRTQVDHPDIPDGLAIIASDDGQGTFAMSYFDQRGISRLFEVTAGDGLVEWRRDDPSIAQTVTITADAPDKLVSKGRISEHGGEWGDDLSQVFTRPT